MDNVRFADILFILLVLAVTFGILALVNRKSTSVRSGSDEANVPREQEGSRAEPVGPEEKSPDL